MIVLTPVLRPRFDHLADLRRSNVGEFLRMVEEIQRDTEKALRV